MSRTGSVNYHVHKPTRQAFEIDAGGVVGRMIAPELAPTPVTVQDVRNDVLDLSFDRDSVGFAAVPSAISDFEGADWQDAYDAELTDFLMAARGAKEVVVFDHTLREDNPNADRKPARNVHSDYSAAGAQKRLIDVLGAPRAADWAAGHYAFVNVWRPVAAPINSAPLGFVRPTTVKPEDWILIDLIYPDRRGHIMGLAANEDHSWVYQSRMTPQEIAYFNIYDNRGQASVAHSAIDMIEDESLTTIRKSIESRTLIRY